MKIEKWFVHLESREDIAWMLLQEARRVLLMRGIEDERLHNPVCIHAAMATATAAINYIPTRVPQDTSGFLFTLDGQGIVDGAVLLGAALERFVDGFGLAVNIFKDESSFREALAEGALPEKGSATLCLNEMIESLLQMIKEDEDGQAVSVD